MKERNKIGHIFRLLHIWATEYLTGCCCRRLFMVLFFWASSSSVLFVFSATQQLMCWKMFFNELMQFTNAVENITVFCKFSKLTKGGVQQVPACMSRVSVWQDLVARRRVAGKGKQGPSGFDGGVLLYQPIESHHCDFCQFSTVILWYIAVFWVLLVCLF